MVKVEPGEYADKNLKIKYILGLVFSTILVYFGIDTILHMVTTFYEHGGSEWQSWHPNTWVFVSDIEFPLIPALALSVVCLVVGPFIASNLLLRWFRRQRTKPIMGIKKEPIQPPKISKRIQQLESEKEMLRIELWKHKQKPSGTAGYILLLLGATALASSIIYASSVLAFIGLGLAFWGALFLFARPVRYVKSSLLDSTAFSSLVTVDRMIADLNYKGKGIYLPPRYLRDLKEGTVFIPSEEEIITPTVEEVAQEKVFLENPKGVCLTPPGLGLANLFERELGTSFTKVDLDYLQNNLPKLFVEGLEIAGDFEMNVHGDAIHVKITEPIYKDLCNGVRKLSSNACSSIGCPLCSSVACALTRATGKPVVIENNQLSADGKVIEAYYRTLGTIPSTDFPSEEQTGAAPAEVSAEEVSSVPVKPTGRHLSYLLPNLVGSVLVALGAYTLVWVGWLTWYDITTWSKSLALIFFGSRTGEAISLGIGMKVIYYL